MFACGFCLSKASSHATVYAPQASTMRTLMPVRTTRRDIGHRRRELKLQYHDKDRFCRTLPVGFSSLHLVGMGIWPIGPSRHKLPNF